MSVDPQLAERWRRELADLGCRALLVIAGSAREPDLAHFTAGPGGPVHLGEALLVLTAEGAAHLAFFSDMERDEAAATGLPLIDPETLEVPRMVREGRPEALVLAGAAARALAAAGVAPGRLALAGRGGAGTVFGACRALAAEGWTIVPADEVMLRLRKAKGERQLAGIRRAAEGAVAALRAVAARLAAATGPQGGAPRPGEALSLGGEPLTVGRLRAEIARTLAARGLEQPAGNIVAPGEEGAVPHNAGTDARRLVAGESLVVDVYPHAPPFADCTRTFCVGTPPEPLARGWAAVRDALALAHRRARPGVRAWEVQREVCELLGAEGWPTPVSDPGTRRGYVHNLGHGVGYELHEFPSFRKAAGAEGVLAVGDVVTLEPGLYEPGDGPGEGWAVRLEDLVWLGPAGAETLTPLPYDLDPSAFLGGLPGDL